MKNKVRYTTPTYDNRIHFDVGIDLALTVYNENIDTLIDTLSRLRSEYEGELYDYYVAIYISDLYHQWKGLDQTENYYDYWKRREEKLKK